MGQRRLAEQIDRLSHSLLNLSSASPQSGDDVRGRVRTDQGSSRSLDRAARSAIGVREGGDSMVAVPEGDAPTTRALSSEVLPAAGGKQQTIRSSRQHSGAAEEVPDIAANPKQAAGKVEKGERELPRMVRAGSALSSCVPEVPLSSAQTIEAAGSATRDNAHHAQEKDKGGGHALAQHRARGERYKAKVVFNAEVAGMRVPRNAGREESNITTPPAVLRGEVRGAGHNKSCASSATTAKRKRPSVNKPWPEDTGVVAPAEKGIGVDTSASETERGAAVPVGPRVASTLPPTATAITAGNKNEGKGKKMGGMFVSRVVRAPKEVRLQPREMSVHRVIEEDRVQPDFPSISRLPLPLQVWEEGRRRPGTPQGKHSDAVVLERGELPTSSDVSKDVEVSMRRRCVRQLVYKLLPCP